MLPGSPFALLDRELTLLILRQLPLKDKVACVTAVCRGWRVLRSDASLWTDVALESGTAAPGWIAPQRFAALLSAGPVVAAHVTSLTLGGDCATAAHIAAALRAAPLPALRSCTLYGKQLNGAAVRALAANAAASTLESIAVSRGVDTFGLLGEPSEKGGVFEGLLQLVAAAPRLSRIQARPAAGRRAARVAQCVRVHARSLSRSWRT